MSEHVISESGGDPAIKLFGTTISVPCLESQTPLVETGNNRSRSFDSRPPHSEESFLNGKGGRDQERDITAVPARSTVCGSCNDSQVLAYKLMDHGTAHQAMASNQISKVDASIVPVKKKKLQLSLQGTIDHQKKACHRSVKVVACPRCDSFETKFCYFNNYNVNQPRHFCKHCQRYWTAGGTLRNVPIGAGRRKNKSGLTMMQIQPGEVETVRGDPGEVEAVRGDPREVALSSRNLYTIRMQQNSTTSLCVCQGKAEEIAPEIWAKTRVCDQETRGKNVYQDDDLLQRRSCTDVPAEMGSLGCKLQGSETASTHSHTPEDERYRTYGCTAHLCFSETWPHGHTTDWHTDMRPPFERDIFDPASAELNVVSADSQTPGRKCQCSLDTRNCANLRWVPAVPAGNACVSCSVASSSLENNGQVARHKERRGKCAATSLRIHDYAFGCLPSMGNCPEMLRSLKAVKAEVPRGFVCKTGTIEALRSRHVNPAAMRRSMAFQESNQI